MYAFSCLSVTFAAVAHAQSIDFPYHAKVLHDNAVVRSGPGENHYGTDQLETGNQVQVFRQDPGGWLAIRPPEGSFSLVQKDDVETLPNGKARVTHSDAVAWVGTNLSPAESPMWQVKLRKGEILHTLGVVDRQKYGLNSDEPDWIQVTPPAGEFRWIDSADVEPYPGNASSTVNSLSENQSREHSVKSGLVLPTGAGARDSESPIPFESWDATSNGKDDWSLEVESGQGNSTNGVSDLSNEEASRGWKPARQTISNFVDQRSGFVGESPGAAVVPSGWIQDSSISTPSGSFNNVERSQIFDSTSHNPGPELRNGLQSGATSSNSYVQNLEMRLTQEMLKSPTHWELVQIAAEAQVARTAAMLPEEVAAADRLLEKIRKCREIKAGFRATDEPGRNDLQTNLSPRYVDNSTSARGQLLHSYDAQGFLNELVVDGGLGPSSFVLQDNQGRITHHVAAPPGLNLRRYLKQRVGIIGNRGFDQRLKLEHVTANRIIAIDTLRR